jgi:outer membrane protein OmpA-like peptidoglycan-associated protein
MNIQSNNLSKRIVVVSGFFLLFGCAAQLTAPDGAATARSKLTELQSNAELANLAPVEIKEADAAVVAAEVPRKESAYATHLVLIANSKVDIARARAQSRLYEDQRQALSQESETARLDARTLEADTARADAMVARDETDAAMRNNEDLQRQIEALNARETDRGLVITLGDLLFATGKSDLTGGAAPNLNKLAVFLDEYADRTVFIEGHTDNVGSESMNIQLSQRRADSVKTYLVSQGIAPGRLSTAGLGESSPLTGNNTATERQQNRRVEVIISNINATSSRD